jgi:hypothetical protein
MEKKPGLKPLMLDAFFAGLKPCASTQRLTSGLFVLNGGALCQTDRAFARWPTEAHPHEQSSRGAPVSDDETIAKVGHPAFRYR